MNKNDDDYHDDDDDEIIGNSESEKFELWFRFKRMILT